jgi:hypothetical protein
MVSVTYAMRRIAAQRFKDAPELPAQTFAYRRLRPARPNLSMYFRALYNMLTKFGLGRIFPLHPGAEGVLGMAFQGADRDATVMLVLHIFTVNRKDSRPGIRPSPVAAEASFRQVLPELPEREAVQEVIKVGLERTSPKLSRTIGSPVLFGVLGRASVLR